MPRRFLVLASAVVMGAFASSAAVAAGQGFYVGLGAGLALVNKTDITGRVDPDNPRYNPPLDATADTENGFGVAGALGYRFASGFRIEGEVGYRKNDLDGINVRHPGTLVALLPPGSPAAALTGDQELDADVAMLTFMANLWHDIDLGNGWMPYLGGGIGLGRFSVFSKSADPNSQTLVDDKDSVFAYQFGGGIGRTVDESGGQPVVISLDYRYFGTEDPTFKGSLTGAETDSEYSGHHIGIGLRIGF